MRAWSGAVAATEVSEATAEYYRAGDRSKLEYIIVDLAGVTEVCATASEIRNVSEADQGIAEFKLRLRIAVVAPKDVTFGLARMWEIYAKRTGWNIRIFRLRPDAVAWISTPPSNL